MKPHALLISGNENQFKEVTSDLGEYLSSIGCSTTIHTISFNPLKTMSALRIATKNLERGQPFLLVYNGHGSQLGWYHPLLLGFPYWLIASILKNIKGPVFVINEACYGLKLVDCLKKVRDPKNTGFISPWDSRDVSYGGPCEDALEAWPQGLTAEETIVKVIFSDETGDHEMPVQERWGVHFDHLFFPPS